MEIRDELARASGPTATSRIGAGDNDGAAERRARRASPRRGTAPTETATSVAAELDGQGRHLAWPTPWPGSDGEFQPLVPPRGSVAASVQAAVPGCAGRRPRCTTCRPRSSATSTTRSRPTCSSAPTTPRPCECTAEIVAPDPRPAARSTPARCPRHADRGVHRGAAPAERPLQDPGGGEAHRHRRDRRPRSSSDEAMRLYDTARAGRSCRSSRARSSRCTRAASRRTTPPTSGHAADVRHLRRAAAPPARPRPRDPLRAQRHRRRRPAPRARPRSSASTTSTSPPPRRPASTATCRRSTCCRASSEPRATSAIADIRGFIGMVLDRGHAYAGRRRRLLRRVDVPALRPGVSHYDEATMLELGRRARRQPRRPEQAQPARLRALAAVGRGRAGVGVAVGPGPARLAHRVLGAGPARARHHHRPARRRHRPDLPAPRVRGGPVARRPPASRSCATGCTCRWCASTATKMSKSLGNLVFVSDLLKEWDPRGHPPGDRRPPLPRRRGTGRRAAARAAAARLDALAGRPGAGDGAPRRGAGRARRRPRHPGARRRHRRRRRRPGKGVAEAAALLGVDLCDPRRLASESRHAGRLRDREPRSGVAEGRRYARRPCPRSRSRSRTVPSASCPTGATAADLAASIGRGWPRRR